LISALKMNANPFDQAQSAAPACARLLLREGLGESDE